MIMISSEAGVRMAKAYAAMNEAHDADNQYSATYREKARFEAAKEKYYAAARQVSKELVEQNLHDMTGP